MFFGLIPNHCWNAINRLRIPDSFSRKQWGQLRCGMFCLLVAIGLIGCSTKAEKGGTVGGSVTLDGAPLVDADIAFVGQGENAPFASATTDESGNFELLGDGRDETVVAGRYKVTFSTFADGDPYSDPPVPDTTERCHINYNQSSQIFREVTVDGENRFVFALTSDGALPE